MDVSIKDVMNYQENPFVFGKAVDGSYFTDRREEAERLSANLTHGINTVLISPRRWGKTSLVKRVIDSNTRTDVKFVYLDVFACKSEYEFYHLFANEVIKQTSSKLDEWIAMGKNFLSNITPKFSFGSDPLNDFALSFEWNQKDGTEKDILQLPEKIAQEKGVRMVVCIDEFQQIDFFSDPVKFQKVLRTVWQHQQNTTYCMFGSKKHLMTQIFSDASCPFYKFGDMMFLKKIPTEEWVPYIVSKFKQTGKEISDAQAQRICEVSENLSSYVQQLAWGVWYKTEKVVTDEIVEIAVDTLLEQNRPFFQRDVEGLTSFQMKFLKAMASGVRNGFSRKEIMRKYKLESSANIQSAKKSLIAKEIIDTEEQDVYISDPLFRLWIERNVK